MLPYSKKPQIIRLHHLEEIQRNRYIGQFTSIGYEWLPHKLSPFLPFIGDAYYAFITLVKCQRRLGEEYTYVAKYIEKHYEEEGLLINKKYKVLMFILQIIQRHLVKSIMGKLIEKIQKSGQKIRELTDIVLGDEENILSNGKWFMLMLFMLGWNKHYNLVDTILGVRYIYTFKHKKQKIISYKVEGFLLLAVFVIKMMRIALNVHTFLNKKQKKKKQSLQQKVGEGMKSESEDEQLCRICYGNIQNKSSTCCGHVFCWGCILKYVSSTEECPVCRSKCLAREIVQLQNF